MKRPLSWLINRFTMLAAGEDLRLTVPAEQAAQLRDLLRELRARRVAMGRVADDEVNAPRDMCCCGRQFADGWTRPLQFAEGCPLHPGPCDGEAATNGD